MLADKCVQLLGNDTADIGNGFGSKVLNVRAKALKGLVELVHGNLESGMSSNFPIFTLFGCYICSYQLLNVELLFFAAESFFQGLQDEKGCTGEVSLIAQYIDDMIYAYQKK